MQDVLKGAKYLWQLPRYDRFQAVDIAHRYTITVPIAQTLMSRGFLEPEHIDSFLFSSYEHDVAHPSLMKDTERAVERIKKALDNDEKILIFGDYDVDGITSSALMMLCLAPLGANINFFLPNRVRDGYGLSTKIVERAVHNGYQLIITVDNGIAAFDPAARARELGIDLIITDHHRPHGHVPDAYAIVNPQQNDCGYPYKTFAGVGVIFKVLSLLYEKLGKELPEKAYELLLLGTVADVVPLTGENRYWVRKGLSLVNKTESYALKVLKRNGKLTKSVISSLDIGFCITPQINALGRLEDARQGVKFLIGADEQETDLVGRILLQLNETRKDIERSILAEIVAKIDSGAINLAHENLIMAASSDWPAGVIGLVASRLVSAYGRPAILFHVTKDGIAKGSCRSIGAFNMFNALDQSRDILISFGGHSVAAGLSLSLANVPLLKERIESLIAGQLTPDDLKQKIVLDGTISLSDVTSKFVHDLHYLEPFGNENPEPLFYVPSVTLVGQPTLLKDAHVKCSVFADGVIKPLLFFNRPELLNVLIEHGDKSFGVAARVNENHWNGKVNLDLVGTDIALSE